MSVRAKVTSVHRSTKIQQNAGVCADLRSGEKPPWSVNQANRRVCTSAKLRIAKFLNNSYEGYESGYELSAAPGMLMTPSS
jgi:hypothetical protein